MEVVAALHEGGGMKGDATQALTIGTIGNKERT